jgi:hypothetical protein
MATIFGPTPHPARWARVLALLAVPAAILLSACAVGVRQPATDITKTSAVLNGKALSTTGGPGSYHIEYGPTSARTETTPTRTIDFVVNESHPVAEPVDGLDPGTTYHFAVCAEDSENPGDPFCSPDQTFTTDSDPGAEDSVTGTVYGERGEPSPQVIWVFDAQAGPSGQNPRGTVRIYASPTFPPGSTTLVATGQVSCLSATGNRAMIGVEFSDPNFPFRQLIFVVEDNDGTGQDEMSYTDPATEPPTTCEVPGDPGSPIYAGDITVVDAPSPTQSAR